MTPLERRHVATQATVYRYQGRPFRWGSVDCARMAAFHVKQLGIRVSLARAGAYRSPRSATAALKRLGFDTLEQAVDAAGLTPITPAAALMGDIVSFEADHPIGALGIVVGNGNMLAFHESHDAPVVMTMCRIRKAWRVI